MKRGRCPKCGSAEVYRRRNAREPDCRLLSGKRTGFMKSDLARPNADYYICLRCGYHETYFVLDDETQRVLVEGWDRVKNGGVE